jgi:hypothetical protein
MVPKWKYIVFSCIYICSVFKAQTRINSKSTIYTKRLITWPTSATTSSLDSLQPKTSLFGGNKLDYSILSAHIRFNTWSCNSELWNRPICVQVKCFSVRYSKHICNTKLPHSRSSFQGLSRCLKMHSFSSSYFLAENTLTNAHTYKITERTAKDGDVWQEFLPSTYHYISLSSWLNQTKAPVARLSP